jgi:dipeptidyl-peptidase-4
VTDAQKRLTIADVARYPRPGTLVPGRLGFVPGGDAITYLFSEGGNLSRSLWRYDVATGERTVIAGPPGDSGEPVSREEELRRERARMREVGVTDYQFAKDARPPVLLVPSGGRLTVARGDEPLRDVPRVEGAIDPRLSPDGRLIAFVRDGELFVVGSFDGQPSRQLTSGAEEGLTNGLADFIHQEELDQDRGFWWSPDSSRIAYMQADSRHIPRYPIVHQGKDGIDVEHHRYPFAGEPNAKLRLGVVAVASGETRWLHLGQDEDIYVPRVQWRPDGSLAVQVLSRDQKSLQLLAFDVDSGGSQLPLEERTGPWVNLSHDARFLESGEFLWSSERSGFRHLYLYGSDGSLIRQLTSGDWMVSHVVEIDEKRRLVYFAATKESVLERHLYRVSLDGGDVERLTQEPGWHGCLVSPNGSKFLDVWSTMERPPSVTLRDTDTGSVEATLFANDGMTAESLGLRPPEIVQLPAADGSTRLYGAVYAPEREPGRRYPIIASVYGGPHVQRVIDDWSMTVDLRAQYLAQQGFVVFKLDNRGSANRGLAFEAALDRRMGTVEVEDQAAGVRWLAENRPSADASRTGIYGWSYGGYMTLMCMLREPDLFKTGVAGAPVTDWDGYDTAYTERYMGTPQSNPGGYRQGSVLTHAGNLAGHLLVVHGMIDENVQFRHTGRLIVALTQEQKDFELLLFPEERHMPRDQAGLEYQERRVIEFLERHV